MIRIILMAFGTLVIAVFFAACADRTPKVEPDAPGEDVAAEKQPVEDTYSLPESISWDLLGSLAVRNSEGNWLFVKQSTVTAMQWDGPNSNLHIYWSHGQQGGEVIAHWQGGEIDEVRAFAEEFFMFNSDDNE